MWPLAEGQDVAMGQGAPPRDCPYIVDIPLLGENAQLVIAPLSNLMLNAHLMRRSSVLVVGLQDVCRKAYPPTIFVQYKFRYSGFPHILAAPFLLG